MKWFTDLKPKVKMTLIICAAVLGIAAMYFGVIDNEIIESLVGELVED